MASDRPFVGVMISGGPITTKDSQKAGIIGRGLEEIHNKLTKKDEKEEGGEDVGN
jgi:hypothetical protein